MQVRDELQLQVPSIRIHAEDVTAPVGRGCVWSRSRGDKKYTCIQMKRSRSIAYDSSDYGSSDDSDFGGESELDELNATHATQDGEFVRVYARNSSDHGDVKVADMSLGKTVKRCADNIAGDYSRLLH